MLSLPAAAVTAITAAATAAAAVPIAMCMYSAAVPAAAIAAAVTAATGSGWRKEAGTNPKSDEFWGGDLIAKTSIYILTLIFRFNSRMMPAIWSSKDGNHTQHKGNKRLKTLLSVAFKTFLFGFHRKFRLFWFSYLYKEKQISKDIPKIRHNDMTFPSSVINIV
jgi:hypothetical protein